MADNVYAMLQQAWAVSKGSDANMYGVEVAIVTNVKDPDQLGRVKVCFPRLPGKPESDWARVAQPSAGDGRGFYWLPEVSDEVLVAFERGQANVPYVIGALWNGKDKPMKDAYTADNTTRMIQTKSGHQIVLDDKSGAEKMIFADGSGKRTLTFDVKDKKFLIEAKEGDVEIHSKKKLVLQCEDLEIKTSKTGKITIGTTFDLKVADKAGFKAGPKMELKATKVNLNPPSLSIAALVTAAMQAAQAAAAAAAAAGAQQQQQQQAAAAGAAPAGPATVPTSTPAVAGAPAAARAAAGAAAAPGVQKAGAAAPAGAAWTKAPAGGAAGTGGTAAGSGTGGTAGGTAAPAGTAAGTAPRIVSFLGRIDRDGTASASLLCPLLKEEISLLWKVENADKVRISPDVGDLPASAGSTTIHANAAVDYEIIALGGGQSSPPMRLRIVPHTEPDAVRHLTFGAAGAPRIVEFAVGPARLGKPPADQSSCKVAPGDRITVCWKVQGDCDSLALEPLGRDAQALTNPDGAGDWELDPSKHADGDGEVTYRLTMSAEGSSGPRSDVKTVTVKIEKSGQATKEGPKVLRFTMAAEEAVASAPRDEPRPEQHFSVRKGEKVVLLYKVADDADYVAIDPPSTRLDEKEGERPLGALEEGEHNFVLIARNAAGESARRIVIEVREGSFVDLTRERVLWTTSIPLVHGGFGKLELEIEVKATGTLELGQLESGEKQAWIDRLVERLKQDLKGKLLSLVNPASLLPRLSTFHPESGRVEFTRKNDGYELKFKFVGAMKEPDVEVEATFIVFSYGEHGGKVHKAFLQGELAVARPIFKVPDFELGPSGKAVVKDLGLVEEAKLVVEPDWVQIAKWLATEAGMDAVLGLSFFAGAILCWIEVYRQQMTILEWHNAPRTVRDDAEDFARAYMLAIDAKVDGPINKLPAWSAGWDEGWEHRKKALEAVGTQDAFDQWLAKHRSELEVQVKREAEDLARRAAWEVFNESSRSFQDQSGAWLWIFEGRDPIKAGHLELFQRYCAPSAPADFKSGNWTPHAEPL